MPDVPIFDSLTHPTVNGDWILPRYPQSSTLSLLKNSMEQAGVKWAFAVGMANIGGYEETTYINFIKNSKIRSLFPIAYISPHEEVQELKSRFKKLKNLGYFGIKLHPRLSNFCPDQKVANIVNNAFEQGLITLLCTYPYGLGHSSRINPESIMHFLEHLGSSKIILLHSGAIRLLEYMEIARVFTNVLLDLSFSICKYPGSSLDLDISFMFKHFDRRICIGSDFPEFSPVLLRERFNILGKNVPLEKLENIAYRNLIKFCGMEKLL